MATRQQKLLLMSGQNYTAAANALFAAMTTKPTAARKKLINNLIVSLQSSGVWSLLDVFYIMAAADSQAAGLNWKNPGTFTLSPVNAPTFTADRGYQGDGATSFLTTGYTPSTNAINMTLNSASVWTWSRTAAAGAGTEVDVGTGTILLACRSSANQARVRANDGTTNTITSNDGSGFFGVSRADAATKKAWWNGAQLGADQAVASTAIASANQTVCGSGATFSTRQLALASWGAALTGKEAAFYNINLTYLQAIGAA